MLPGFLSGFLEGLPFGVLPASATQKSGNVSKTSNDCSSECCGPSCDFIPGSLIDGKSSVGKATVGETGEPGIGDLGDFGDFLGDLEDFGDSDSGDLGSGTEVMSCFSLPSVLPR